MTKKNYIAPMACRNMYFVVYPGFELLDLSGPLSVFSSANALEGKTIYNIRTLSSEGGLVSSSAGLDVQTQSLKTVCCDSTSTYLIVGSHGGFIKRARKDQVLCHWLSEQSGNAERFGSVCTGAFVLEAAGVLKDKTVTTHWAGCEDLRTLKCKETVLNEALYHVDGKCWTSAGVTTGIDMALEMLKRDHGHLLMQTVARYLVVYSQRPGNQSQFAVVQGTPTNQQDAFSSLINWLKKEVMRPVKIREMADVMNMSERSFQRHFTEQFSLSPSRYYERMRMEYARDFLLPRHSVDLVATLLGYSSTPAFRTAFIKHFGMSPSTCKKIR